MVFEKNQVLIGGRVSTRGNIPLSRIDKSGSGDIWGAHAISRRRELTAIEQPMQLTQSWQKPPETDSAQAESGQWWSTQSWRSARFLPAWSR